MLFILRLVIRHNLRGIMYHKHLSHIYKLSLEIPSDHHQLIYGQQLRLSSPRTLVKHSNSLTEIVWQSCKLPDSFFDQCTHLTRPLNALPSGHY